MLFSGWACFILGSQVVVPDGLRLAISAALAKRRVSHANSSQGWVATWGGPCIIHMK